MSVGASSRTRVSDEAILSAIGELERRAGPTVRELADRLGFTSTCSVQYRLAALRRRGLVAEPQRVGEKGTAAPRGLVLSDAGKAHLRPEPQTFR